MLSPNQPNSISKMNDFTLQNRGLTGLPLSQSATLFVLLCDFGVLASPLTIDKNPCSPTSNNLNYPFKIAALAYHNIKISCCIVGKNTCSQCWGAQ